MLNIVPLDKRYINQIMDLQTLVDNSLEHDEHYFPTDKKTILKWMKQGALVLGVFDGHELIAASCQCLNGLFFGQPLDKWMKLDGTKIACHEFVVVHPEYRGRGLQRRLMEATVIKCKALGYDTIWCCVHPDNIYSKKNIELSGYEKIAEYTVGGWPRYIYSKKL